MSSAPPTAPPSPRNNKIPAPSARKPTANAGPIPALAFLNPAAMAIPSQKHLRFLGLLLSGGILAWTVLRTPAGSPDSPVVKSDARSTPASLPVTADPNRKPPATASIPGPTSPVGHGAPRQAGNLLGNKGTVTARAEADEGSSLLLDNHRVRRQSPAFRHQENPQTTPALAPHDGGQSRTQVAGPDALSPAVSIPPETIKPPIAFALPEHHAEPDSLEAEVIHQTQQGFADEMTSGANPDPASPEYAEHWKRAAEAHDDRLRRLLGWEAFNRLSAAANRQTVPVAAPNP